MSKSKTKNIDIQETKNNMNKVNKAGNIKSS